jgi:hypothetical protein
MSADAAPFGPGALEPYTATPTTARSITAFMAGHSQRRRTATAAHMSSSTAAAATRCWPRAALHV